MTFLSIIFDCFNNKRKNKNVKCNNDSDFYIDSDSDESLFYENRNLEKSTSLRKRTNKKLKRSKSLTFSTFNTLNNKYKDNYKDNYENNLLYKPFINESYTDIYTEPETINQPNTVTITLDNKTKIEGKVHFENSKIKLN